MDLNPGSRLLIWSRIRVGDYGTYPPIRKLGGAPAGGGLQTVARKGLTRGWEGGKGYGKKVGRLVRCKHTFGGRLFLVYIVHVCENGI